MANEIGTTLLNSLTKSTFDIGNMSKAIAEAEVAGPRAILERNQDRVNTELDALKYLKLNLNAFNTYVSDLSSPELFNRLTATSSNESVVSVTAESGAATGSFQVESRKLAQNHTLVIDQTFASASSSISDGTFSFTVGGQLQQVPVNSSNNSLEGLQKYINNNDYGVSAAIIKNGGSYQMMLTSETAGASGEITFGAGNPAELTSFTTTANAQDAEMVINGLTVTNSSNTFDEVIEGLTFQLKSESIGVNNTINVNQSTESVDETIRSFVEVYNQLDTILNELGKYDTSDLTEEELESEEYQYYGDLAGNSILRSVETQIKSSLSGAIDELSGGFNSLAQIGISFDRDGVLQIDETNYTAALNNNLEAVSNLFSKGGSSDDNFINYLGASDRTQTGSYEVFIDQLATRATVTATPADATIDLLGDASFMVSVDGSSAEQVVITAGSYSADDFAKLMADSINNVTEVASSGASVSMSFDGSSFILTSDRYGGNSSLNLTGFNNLTDAGFSPDIPTIQGQNVDGTIVTESGNLNIGAYADQSDGRKVDISDFAVIDGKAAEVRGLSFEVFGGPTDGSSRGNINFAAGFASRVEEAVNNLFEEDTGLISQRIDSLTSKTDDYEEKGKEIDARYDKLLLKYQIQFSTLQSLLSSAEQTRNMLTATFSSKE